MGSEGDVDVRITPEDLQTVQLLGSLPLKALEELALRATVSSFEPGQLIFKEGDDGLSLHIVRGGIVKIVHQEDVGDEAELVLQTLTSGQVFGELAILDPAPRSATAIAIDKTETIQLHKDDLDRVLDEEPTAARKMLASLARSLTNAKEELAGQNQVLDFKVRERTQELRETQLEVVRRLGRAAEFRDDDTGLHISRMSRFCERLANEAGFSEGECELLLQAAPMHDIGKIGIPDGVLLKPGKLDADEWDVMRSHTLVGAEILSGGTSKLLEVAREIALAHHEKWDGSGYPNGISKETIPIFARIAALADVFDALTSVRPYKEAWTNEKAFALIEENAGSHFDPHLAKLFLAIRNDIERIQEEARGLQSETGFA
ncbi:MAG: cyclic di-GMP phosphodiesterase [Actinomycetota bacterium]|nr:cyclic di-GMP phosphodiesterase [Actinomycetota bacterium]